MIVNKQKESDHDNLKKQSFYKFFFYVAQFLTN
jgi:hypothetical protein